MPYVKWHGRDWLGDPMLRMVGPEVRGVWIDLLCAMMNSEPYGHLAVNGKPMTDEQAARLTGLDKGTFIGILAQIKDANISSRTDDGMLYSRRLVRDHAQFSKASECGRRGGGNPLLREKNEEARSQKPEARSAIKDTFIGTIIGNDALDSAKEDRSAKKPYAEFGKVRLTDEEHAKLAESYGDRLTEAIGILDTYLASKGKRYSSHYAVMKRGGWVWEKSGAGAVDMPEGVAAFTLTTNEGPLDVTQPKIDAWKAEFGKCSVMGTLKECEAVLRENPKSKRDTLVYVVRQFIYWQNKD
jgi:hypothetical protein